MLSPDAQVDPRDQQLAAALPRFAQLVALGCLGPHQLMHH